MKLKIINNNILTLRRSSGQIVNSCIILTDFVMHFITNKEILMSLNIDMFLIQEFREIEASLRVLEDAGRLREGG